MDLMTMAEAAIFFGPGQAIEVRRFEIPEAKPREILVKILGCTICGSDLHTVAGRRSGPTPTILGHEAVGEIVQFGDESSHYGIDGRPLFVGDRVVWTLVANCGHCFFCRADLPQKCESATKYGHCVYEGKAGLFGGFASHNLLPANTKLCSVPKGLPLEVLCPSSCATATIASACETAGLKTQQTVVVVGAGMLGLTACAMLKELGADQVICVEKNELRRALSRRFGADLAIGVDDLEVQVKSVTEGRGADLIIECTGSDEIFIKSLACHGLGAKIVLVGAVFPGEGVRLHTEKIVRSQLTITGIHNYGPRHLASALRFLEHASAKFPFAELVSRWYPLHELDRAFELASQGEHIRVGIQPS